MTRSIYSTEIHSTRQKSARSVNPYMAILHHGATTSADQIIAMMVNETRQVSAHQVVKDTRRASVVEDELRAWSLSSAYWDSAAHVVECANDTIAGWTISEASHESLGLLVADWSLRYGWWPHRDGPAAGWTVIGHREVYTIHGASYATACPGGMDLNKVVWYAQKFRNEWATGGGPGTPSEEEEIMSVADDIINEIKDALRREVRGRVVFDAGPNGTLGFSSAQVTRAAIVRPGKVAPLSADPGMRAQKVSQWRDAAVGGMLIGPAFAGKAIGEQPQAMTSTEFYEFMDWCADVSDTSFPYGRFVKNSFEVEAGPTVMVRVLPQNEQTFNVVYQTAAAVWKHGAPVELLKSGKPFNPATKAGQKGALFVDGSFVPLSAAEVQRANDQRPGGQIWTQV